mmetsp:Transcript_4465/g.6632  ORF Transcript_4465/g.6632 Transcript_4465/m.6632 type:complete len:154 (+) Transcript_4465:1626-2087(+)
MPNSTSPSKITKTRLVPGANKTPFPTSLAKSSITPQKHLRAPHTKFLMRGQSVGNLNLNGAFSSPAKTPYKQPIQLTSNSVESIGAKNRRARKTGEEKAEMYINKLAAKANLMIINNGEEWIDELSAANANILGGAEQPPDGAFKKQELLALY